MIPWMVGTRSHCPTRERERETPDTTTKPEGKALKTSSAASATPLETLEGGGTNTLKDGVLPPDSSARGRVCVMCPVRIGSSKLIPCCLCNNWCHVPRSYQTCLGIVCPCHIKIVDPKRKIMVLSRAYMEECVVLPTRPAIRSETRLAGKDISCKLSRNDMSASRWCSATRISILVQKHAWISACLIRMPEASDSSRKAEHNDPQPDVPQPLPTINIFELWEDGSHSKQRLYPVATSTTPCVLLWCAHELPSQDHIAKGRCGGSCEQLRVCSQTVWSCEQLVESRNPLPKPTNQAFKGIHWVPLPDLLVECDHVPTRDEWRVSGRRVIAMRIASDDAQCWGWQAYVADAGGIRRRESGACYGINSAQGFIKNRLQQLLETS